MCTGTWSDKLLISIRTSEESNLAEKVIKRMVARRGTGGGHLTYAGGQIPLKNRNKADRQKIEKQMQERFLKAISAETGPVVRLVKA
jgi:nanoRNase/pAp phosphatase (c-di-AMP/oligoRNAs hydrolase)